ncbi:response regulator [Deferribacterales bacterium Es71-Z0220]|uniref:response regulator n=1 Tax=Deferrivibrio essentukiensis TaxID=2880922 RepID=UPI001F61FCFA|nr:response regulator receiver protein [Deferribacteraceae bacterium]MCB4205063.1 response regulator [Deferrivibrio essentukiensis]
MTKKHIHIIEDSELTIYTIKNALEEEYKISFSTNSVEFFKTFKSGFLPDLYIIDLNLPDIDGIQILNELKDIDIPKIVYSAQTNPEIIEECFNLGAYDFLKKPTPLKEMKSRIYKVFQYHEMLNGKKDKINIEEIKGTVAHYFGQPLTALGAEIYILKKQLPNTEDSVTYSSVLRMEKAYQVLVSYYNAFKNIDSAKKVSYLNGKNILDLTNE